MERQSGLPEARMTHFDDAGRARMVDVGAKEETDRSACARAVIHMQSATLDKIRSGRMAKGDVLAVAQVAAVMGAKRTADLIPMCHPLLISGVDVVFSYLGSDRLQIDVVVKTSGKTGVEMEALTAASVGALTVYDMCKAIDRGMTIAFVGLWEKHGGKNGDYFRVDDELAQGGGRDA